MKLFGALIGFALCHVPAHASDDQVLRGPAPEWIDETEMLPVPEQASGLIFVRYQHYAVHLDERGQASYNAYRLRILHPNALQVGNLGISWRPSAGAPTVHMIRVHRDGEVIDALSTATFEILRREEGLEAASLTGILTAIHRVSDLRVGDELEVALTTRSDDPTLGDSVAGLLLLGPEPGPGRFRLGLSWQAGQEPQIRMTPDLEAVARRGPTGIDLRFDNPQAAIAPNDAPPRYHWRRILQYSDFPDWGAVSARFAPLYRQAATLAGDSPIKAEARRIAAAHNDPMARASAALALVQGQVRYIYVGLDSGNLTPVSADETWRRRYGDCKGKTVLLLALLAELGVEAEAVLVNNSGSDDALNERLASPAAFDHVLVRATIAGNRYWLDGTLPAAATPALVPIIPYRWVLPVAAQDATLERLPWSPAALPNTIALFEIDARAGFDEPARMVSTTIARGIQGLQEQIGFSALTQAQLLSAMQQQLVGETWDNIESAQWRYDSAAGASILTITGTGTPDWDDDGGNRKSMRLPGGGFNPPSRRIRPAEQDQEAPYFNAPEFVCHVTTVRLPVDSNARQWSYNDDIDTRIFGRTYHRAFEYRDGAIRMIRASRVEQLEIDVADARRDNGRIADFDNSMAQIRYNPSRNGQAPERRSLVPATYEIDWTSNDVPCLSPADTAE